MGIVGDCCVRVAKLSVAEGVFCGLLCCIQPLFRDTVPAQNDQGKENPQAKAQQKHRIIRKKKAARLRKRRCNAKRKSNAQRRSPGQKLTRQRSLKQSREAETGIVFLPLRPGTVAE